MELRSMLIALYSQILDIFMYMYTYITSEYSLQVIRIEIIPD